MGEDDKQMLMVADCIDSLLMDLRRSHFLPLALREYASNVSRAEREYPSVSELELVQLNKIRFRDRKDIHYAMSSLFSALHGTNRPIVYIISGNKEKTTMYFGFWNQLGEDQSKDICATLKGFIPGTEFSPATSIKKLPVLRGDYISSIVGIPSEKQAFQDEKRVGPVEYGIERLADAMTNDNYTLMIIAKPINEGESDSFFKSVSSILDYTHRLTKTTEQKGTGIQSGSSTQTGSNFGGSEQTGSQITTGSSVSEVPWVLKRWYQGTKRFLAGGTSPQTQLNQQTGSQSSSGKQWGISYSKTENISSSKNESSTSEYVNHQAVYAEELLKMIQSRLKTGIGEGLWKTSVLFVSDRKETVSKGCNILKGMWSGSQSHQDPIQIFDLSGFVKNRSTIMDDVVTLSSNSLFDDNPLGLAYSGNYTWLTSSELAIEANLPYYELPSLSSENMVDYGRFLPSYEPEKQIKLGCLVDRNIKTDTPVWMDTLRLNRHLFVTGLTGAGKSNTIRSILLELARLGIPFLVIEPVKSEYRLLNSELKKRFQNGTSKFDHIDVFSLAGGKTEKLVLNPFAFEIKPSEDAATALISHIDRLKAVFNSSLGMYSSMPYILEEMIYKAYRNAGWNLETGKNAYFEIARKYLVLSEDSELRNMFLPTLSELAGLVDEAIKGFFPDKSDYGISLVGALKSRLNSLSRGAKGLLLNQRLSLPVRSMLERPCVIELESFADNDEKAFIMALLLSRIYEFRAGKLAKELKHVLVIEEAHRLLTKPPQTGEFSSNSRGKSVEVFSDMLAEIRAYGQGIVIADQIPAKLIPDVIKNTDIKIVHRLMSKEDRESVGTAMNLTEKQIQDLNRATPGLATVSFDGLNSAIRVQIQNTPIDVNGNNYVFDPMHADVMKEYRQKVFLGLTEKDSSFRISDKTDCSYGIVLRLFFISIICERTDALVSFRNMLTRSDATNKYHPILEPDDLWGNIAEGLHLFMSDLIQSGVNPGEAGILVSSMAAFALPWSKKAPFNTPMNRFIALAKKDINLLAKTDAEKKDFYTHVLQYFVDTQYNNFHNRIAKALLESSPANWEPLQKMLNDVITNLLFSVNDIDPIARINTSLRLIRCFKTNQEALVAKAGLAYKSLLSILKGPNATFITQKWTED